MSVREDGGPALTLRICPERDALCPHGAACPYSIDKYYCDLHSSHVALRAERDKILAIELAARSPQGDEK